jgi:ribonuclease HI
MLRSERDRRITSGEPTDLEIGGLKRQGELSTIGAGSAKPTTAALVLIDPLNPRRFRHVPRERTEYPVSQTVRQAGEVRNSKSMLRRPATWSCSTETAAHQGTPVHRAGPGRTRTRGEGKPSQDRRFTHALQPMQGYGPGMLILESDGGCEPNPGQGRFGVVAKMGRETIWTHGEDIGYATNNVAEWKGALAALNYAIGYTLAYQHDLVVELRMDSLLVVNQLNHRWKVKNAGLKPLADEGERLLRALCEQNVTVCIKWIPRERNTDADALTQPRQLWR